MLLKVGDRLGPYEIQAAIGAGGMGEVYRARDSRLGRDVAIKILPAAFSADPQRLHRFEQEARAAAALNHHTMTAILNEDLPELPVATSGPESGACSLEPLWIHQSTGADS